VKEKKMKKLFLLLAVVSISWSSVAQGQTSWSLADGLLASIPDPNNLATAQNPVTVGQATWTFRPGGGTAAYTTPVKDPANSVGGAMVELPAGGIMWWNGGGMAGLAYFDAAQTLPSPCGADLPCTNYQAGDAGGYTNTGAVWTTLAEGWFKVTWGGFAGRGFISDPPRQMDLVLFTGPAPYYDTTPSAPGRALEVRTIKQTDNLGAANALVEQKTVHLAAGEAVDLYINGNDWAGLVLTIDKLLADTNLTISTDTGGIVTTVTPFVGTQLVVPTVPIAINAPRFVDCANHHVYAFTHWEAGVNTTIANPSSASTTVTVTTPNTPAQITAHYVNDGKCGDECHAIVTGDLNQDCIVDVTDFGMLAQHWLTCTQPACID
jgi:hypothetical protein